MKNTESLDSMLEDFDLSTFSRDKKKSDEIVLPIRVKPAYKKMYDELQKDSNRNFVKTLKKIVEASIEKKYVTKA